MNEARRFIRYLFPGLVFVILLLLYLFLSARDPLLDDLWTFMLEAGNGGGLLQAGVFILFIAGAGYFFATVYHASSKLLRCRLPNHSGLLKDAMKKKWVIVYNRTIDGDVPLIKDFSSSEAWSIHGAYYHKRIHKKKFKNAHMRIISLADTLHGLGASVVGSCFSLVAWILLNKRMVCHWPEGYWYIVPVLVTILMGRNYFLTGMEAQNFIDGITAEFMAEESENGKTPIPLHYPSV